MTKPLYISLDVETRSLADLRECGVYKYAEHPSTDVWCVSYGIGGSPIQTWLRGDPFPNDLRDALDAGGYIRAWNAQFERIIWRDILVRKHGWPALDTRRFVCSMVVAAAAGLPMSLEEAAIVLKLSEQKDAAGARLMMQMTKPRKVMDDGTIIWWEDAAKIARLAAYCEQDVRTESAIWRRLPPCMDRRERALYLLDQDINDRGVAVDLDLVGGATRLASREAARLDAELLDLTGGSVPGASKLADLKRWVAARGVRTPTLDKVSVARLLESDKLPLDVKRALEIRAAAGKTSVAKYAKAEAAACEDGRARGLLQFYGAGTGRWAGRLLQPQNYPKHPKTWRLTPELYRGILDGTLTEDVMETLSFALRGMFVPSPGSAFYVADFNAIEARVVAWLAGEMRLVKLFASGGKVYETMASLIFGVPVDQVTPEQRDVGKMVVLGCGFGMGARKFAAQTGVEEALAERAVRAYRDVNPRIPELWYGLDDAAVRTVRTGAPSTCGRLRFRRVAEWLALDLPVGRSLWYHRPRIVEREVPWSTPEKPVFRPAVQVDVRDNVTRQWVPLDMYGGIWTENATQAVARDLMADAMVRVEAAGYRTVLTIHDELIAEADPSRDIGEFVALLSVVPEWAPGCPIKAEGWTGDRYRK